MPRADYEGWMAGAYDEGRRLGPDAFAAWGEAAGPFVAPGPGVVVDLGAGTGRFSGELARWSGGPVVAIEPTGAMASLARAKGQPGVTVLRAPAEALPLATGSVRAVWMSQVVHHIDDLPAAARELARIVRRGGHVMLRGELRDKGTLGVGAANTIYRYFPDAGRVAATFPTKQEILGTLEPAGFATVLVSEVAQVTAASLSEFHARMATRADSALAALDDETFEAGLASLARDAAAERDPTPVADHLALAVLKRVDSG